LDGKLTTAQFSECLEKAISGCKSVYEIQKEALMKKYFGDELEVKEEA